MSHSMGQRSFFKDVQQLYRKIDTSTDGQASIVSVNELSVIVSLNPKFGRNAHAAFIVNIFDALQIDCPSAYPKASPEACFITPIFHPDINVCDGSVCLSLFDEWHRYELLQVKADQKTHHRFSDASSDTVPSFAKIRFFLDSLSGTSSWTYYVQDYYCIYFKSQRILIGQPSVNNKISLPSVFYYSEFLGNPDHRCKLGDLYGTLFAGDVLPAMQVHPESRQTSSLCPWYHFYYNSYLSFLTIESVFNLTNLFTYTEPRRESRGSDFSLDDDDGEDLAQVASESLAMGGDFYVDAELENSPQIVESRELAFDAEYKDEEEDDDDEEVEQQPAVEVEMQNMPIKDASSAASSKTYPLKSYVF
ncbi:unnamed protein product, partial [Mesocestoides corti]